MTQDWEWDNREEYAFIRGLGSHVRESSLNRKMTRLEILQGYREGLERRRVWGKMSRDKVFRAIEDEIFDELKPKPEESVAMVAVQ